MYQTPTETKSNAGANVRRISRHFEGISADRMRNKNSDLDELKNVLSVQSRRLLFEENSGGTINRNKNGNSEKQQGIGVISSSSQTLPTKRKNIIKELLETEVTFIDGLRVAVMDYMAYFENESEHIPNTIHFVFANIKEIYEASKKFHTVLSQCHYDIGRIASAFLAHGNLFALYVEYIRNKPTSEFYSNGMFKDMIKERQGQLPERQPLENYLLTPIQRLGRYILFMENLQKVAKDMGKTYANLDEATDYLKMVMRTADNLVAIDSIENCPHDLTKTGIFVAKETFRIKKKYKSVVFLFEKIVVFTARNKQRTDSYFYRDDIGMSDLMLRTTPEQPLIIHLRNFNKCKSYQEDSVHNFELEATSEKVKTKWVNMIECLLWQQFQTYKETTQNGD